MLNNRIMTEKKSLYFLTATVILLAISSLLFGAYDIYGQADGWQMFWITRVPRTLALLLSGMAMSICGLLMQLITQNRFAEPTTTGTVEWAGLGLVLVYALYPAPSLIQRMTGAIIFAFIGTLIFFLILQKIKLQSSLIVPIVGIMLGAIISAVSTFIALVFSLSQSIEVWFTGSFTQMQQGRYEYLWLILFISLIIYKIADKLTIISLGKDLATNLGLNYQALVLLSISLIALATGIVSSVVGQLPFLGLIVPNIVSIFRGDDLRSNLPHVCLLGMAIITFCDIISRSIIAPLEVPVSLILSSLGAGFFILLVLKQRGGKNNG